MNAYDQLCAIREELEDRHAKAITLKVVSQAIERARDTMDSPLHLTQAMVLKHLLRLPDVLNNYDAEMDLLGLAGDISERRPLRSEEDAPDATVDSERKPLHSHTYYREKKRAAKESK